MWDGPALMDVPSPTKAGYIFCLFVLLFYLPIFSSFSSFRLVRPLFCFRPGSFTTFGRPSQRLRFHAWIWSRNFNDKCTPSPHSLIHLSTCIFVYLFIFFSINIEWAKQSRPITSNIDGPSFNSQKMKHWAGKQKKMTAYNSLKM